MSNYHVEAVDRPQALTGQAMRALRRTQVEGISRRELLRGALAAGVALGLAEATLGTIGFLWPTMRSGFGGVLVLGTLYEIKSKNSSMPIDEGSPAYYAFARSFVILVDPAQQRFIPGADDTGDGTALNVRALYQRCPHLGCKPNPCLKNFWLECPCHGSRYDRLGIKAEGAQYGPAPRSMDRFAIRVEANGRLIVDTGKITLGPLPVALGQPGIIPPRSPSGCI